MNSGTQNIEEETWWSKISSQSSFWEEGQGKILTQEKTPLDLPDAKFIDYVLPKNLVVPKPAVNMHGNCHSEFPNKLHIEAHLRVFLKKKKHG